MELENRIGRSAMTDSISREFQIGRYSVTVTAAHVDMPNAGGWIGTWQIDRLPLEGGDYPMRYGDTDIVESEDIAIGMAGAIASVVARSL